MKIFILLFNISSFANFFTPDSPYLERQKDFWKKMYTEISINQTVLHDRNEPSIIYKVIDHEGYSHSSRIKKVRKHVKETRKILKSIGRKRGKRLNKKERLLYSKIPKKYRNFTKRSKGLRYQQGMKEKFAKGVARSHKYLEKVKEIFFSYDLPEELAYLAHVESSYNYKAYSSVGAAGIWQFMRQSAKLFDLTINDYIDERLDPIAATDAAARHFKENKLILKTWPMAITAYNHGPSGIRRASKKLRTKDWTKIVTRYNSRSFRFASKNFYGSFLAAVEVADSYYEYFPELVVENSKEMIEVRTDRKMKVSEILEEQQLTMDKFKEYNPFFKKNVYAKNLKLPSNTKFYVPAALYERPEVQDKAKSIWQRVKDFFASLIGDDETKVASK